MIDGRHHVIVDVDLFDRRKLQLWLQGRVRSVHRGTWTEVGAKLSRIGHWEFEDYDAE